MTARIYRNPRLQKAARKLLAPAAGLQPGSYMRRPFTTLMIRARQLRAWIAAL